MAERRSLRFLLKNECFLFVGITRFPENTRCCWTWRNKGVSFAFLAVRREGGSVGGKIGSEHKEDVNEICGWVCRRKEAGNPKKEAPLLL